MTPKKEADQLVFWYENLLEPYIKDKKHLKSMAKKCALMCINKIYVLPLDFVENKYSKGTRRSRSYWEEVKQEIKLNS